ncbi:MAG: hypothetical protein KAQ62_06430, partial [Cyclobacteriaceae bacterium]|nr:hypothetical protein [Cyclobacteriaceae bacterium]
FSGEKILNISKAIDADFEIIVDNEDEGFELIQPENESALKKWLKIENKTDEQKYVGIRFNRPPSTWKASAQPEFYGKYVLSAYITAKGNGDRQAIWNANIKQTGMHEIYYFVGRLPVRGRGRQGGATGGRGGTSGGQSGGNQDQQNEGSYMLTVFHDDGEEQVILDVVKAEEGWNLLGNYYLSQGPTKVILSNETEGNLVIADAIKWVKVE